MDSNQITIIATIATLLTALATFWTILEMRKQRQNTYLPDLFIKDSFRGFYGFDNDDTFKRFRFEISEESIKEKQITDKSPMIWFEIQLYNIGFGAAKYVNYEWNFNVKFFYDLLVSVNDSENFIFEYSKEQDTETVYVKSSSKEHLMSLPFEKRFATSKFDFLNSSNTGKNNQAITIPDIYTNLLSHYLCLKYEMSKANSDKVFIQDDLKEIPELSIKLNYLDIGNKIHKKTFALNFSAISNFSFKRERFFGGQLGSFLVVSNEIK